jgi:hypothetical protein
MNQTSISITSSTDVHELSGDQDSPAAAQILNSLTVIPISTETSTSAANEITQSLEEKTLNYLVEEAALPQPQHFSIESVIDEVQSLKRRREESKEYLLVELKKSKTDALFMVDRVFDELFSEIQKNEDFLAQVEKNVANSIQDYEAQEDINNRMNKNLASIFNAC